MTRRLRLLFTLLTTDDLGLVTRALPIADELRRRGHDVTFTCTGRAPSTVIDHAGFANRLPHHPIFDLMARGDTSLTGVWGLVRDRADGRYRSRRDIVRRLAPAVPWRRSAPADEPPWDVDHAAAQMGLGNPGFVRACALATERLMDDVDPDVVVDFWNPFAEIAARANHRPLVGVIQADAHPASDGFRWWEERPESVPTPVAAVNRVLARLGVEEVASVAELALGDVTLVVGSPETDPLPDGADVTYIGAAVWDDGTPLPDWLAPLGADRPLVWVYSGNPSYDGGDGDGPLDSRVVLDAAISALGDTDLDVVVTTGNHPLPQDLGGLPRNVHHAPFLPGIALGRRADVMVHHAGYGSCQTGLVTATPSVMIPTYAERESNARRIAGLGAGVMVRPTRVDGRRHVDAAELRQAVDRALTDSTMRRRCEELAATLDPASGARLAADAIEAAAR